MLTVVNLVVFIYITQSFFEKNDIVSFLEYSVLQIRVVFEKYQNKFHISRSFVTIFASS